MIDKFGRKITYLRVSVTDRCNFRCVYCMPEAGIAWKPHSEILTYEEITRITRVAVGLGVKAVRITGGEPLVRRGIVGLAAGLAKLKDIGLEDLSMTTNGSLLAPLARSLREAGLDRVNISLDTLDAGRFKAITKKGLVGGTLAGIGAALAAGLMPVKVNVVLARTVNLAEVCDFAYLACRLPLQVRFIELMPLGSAAMLEEPEFVAGNEVTRLLAGAGELAPRAPGERGAGPARYYAWAPGAAYRPAANVLAALDVVERAAAAGQAGGQAGGATTAGGTWQSGGSIGLITALSNHFCLSCNRLRLTSDGEISPCLWSDRETDIKKALRSGATDEELGQIICAAVLAKPSSHGAVGNAAEKRRMSRLGG